MEERYFRNCYASRISIIVLDIIQQWVFVGIIIMYTMHTVVKFIKTATILKLKA